MKKATLAELTDALDECAYPIVVRGRVHSANILERLRLRYRSDYSREQGIALITALEEALSQAPRVSPTEAFKSREVCILREFLTRNKAWLERFDDQLFKNLKAEFTAYRLGITRANMDASPELQQFTDTKAFLYNYLSHYEHSLKVESAVSPVQILMNGEYVDWEVAKSVLVDQPDLPGVWPWKYGEKGLKNDDFAEWEDPEERAYLGKKHPLPGAYLFTYCAFCVPKAPRYSGEHSWFRLTTPEGKVYEFGKYRPPRVWKLEKALVNFPATIQSPDMNTMWPVEPDCECPIKRSEGTKVIELHFEISEEDFNRALEKVKSIKKRKNLTFGLFDDSCVVMVNEVAAVCGIRLDTASSMLKLYFPLPVIKRWNKIQRRLPGWFVSVIYFLPAVFTNLMLCLFMGAAARFTPEGKRHINSLRDLFNPEKSLLHHPWYLAAVIAPEVEANRPEGKPFGIPK
jgi:hypothetical protein